LGFEIIDIRRFEAKEFSDLLDAESRAWNTILRWDFAASVRIINSCLRDRRLSGYALVGEGKIRGYCFFFYDGEKGIVGDLYVDPELAGLGQERELLEHALKPFLPPPVCSVLKPSFRTMSAGTWSPASHPAAFRAFCAAS